MAAPLRNARRAAAPAVDGDGGVAGRDRGDLADPQRPDAAPSRDVVASAGAGGAQPAAATWRRRRRLRACWRKCSAAIARAAAIALPTKPLHLMYAEPARDVHREPRRRRCAPASPRRMSSRRTTRSQSSTAAARRGRPERVIVGGSVVRARRVCSTPRRRRSRRRSIARSAMASSPIVTVNLWFDRPVSTSRSSACPAGRCSGSSTNGSSSARRVALSLVSSGACGARRRRPTSELIAAAHQRAARSDAGRRAARLLRATVVREPRATFSLAPGQPARPATGRQCAGCLLAGDWIDTGLPATIESAVRSGHRAAEAVSYWVIG